MAVTLSKGENVSLSKTSPGLKKIILGLGWDVRQTDGAAFDLDASAFLLKADGKVRSSADFIFYNQKKSPEGSVESMGDNLTGQGEGDDEQIRIDLTKVPKEVEKIAVVVTIHEADSRKQNFGMVSKSFVRVVNAENDAEVVRYDLSEDFSVETALIFGEVYRNGADWKFRAVGQGFKGGLGMLAKNFGVAL